MSDPILAAVDDVSAVDSAKFEAALARIDALGDHAQKETTLFALACEKLNSSVVLGSVERTRRANLILSRARLSIPQWTELAQAARDYRPELRSAIVRSLPAKLKGIAYGRAASASVAGAARAVALPKVEEAAPDNPGALIYQGRVLLLGNLHEHQRNIKLLNREGVQHDRAATVDEFRKLLCNDTVAIVIARSWWTIIPADNHDEFLQRLFRFSSFTCLRINSTGLISNDLSQIFRTIRFHESRHKDLLVSDSDDLTEFDVAAIRQSAAAANYALCMTLRPGELSTEDAKFITAIANEYIEERMGVGSGNAAELSVTMLSGGKSGAKLLQVAPRNRISPFVVKLDSAENLISEMERVRRFIATEDPQTEPRLFFQQTRAAILYRLIEDLDNPQSPAPTLYEVLCGCMRSEAGSTKPCALENDLQKLIERVIAKLLQLNSRVCPSAETASYAWTGVDGVEAMDSCGIVWHIPALKSGASPLDVLHDAKAHLDTLKLKSTVHGDIHLRNILVRDNREPILIDASYAGPGHPCFDLIRLECALLFQMFRLTDCEDTLKRMLIAVGRGTALDEIQSQYPTLYVGISNRIIIAGMVAIRTACIQLLEQFGGEISHYFAMKLVLAYQALALPDQHAGIIRPVIGAAAEGFCETLPATTVKRVGLAG